MITNFDQGLFEASSEERYYIPETMIRYMNGEDSLQTNLLQHDFNCPITDNIDVNSKQLIFNIEPEIEPETWRNKAKTDWNESDVLHWIADVAFKGNFPCEAVHASNLKVDGRTLLGFSRDEFIEREAVYGGYLYNALHSVGSSLHTIKNEQDMDTTGFTTLIPRGSDDESSFYNGDCSNDHSRMEHMPASSEEKDSDSEPEPKPAGKPGKRPPGRPPGAKAKEKPKKTGRLWEFIRDLLHNRQYCPSLICWEDHSDGVFRFKNSEKVAKIWGSRKGNDKMNYEKLSRAMRYYYKSKVLQPVLGRKLVYKFGPTARGWQSENPNFGH